MVKGLRRTNEIICIHVDIVVSGIIYVFVHDSILFKTFATGPF